ncbi:hypothetical protein TIFTF001_021903 [Ficus carica]|uniref:Uncharacterized protein n=1 Tax=Ficus carica TaxID=3494 RepID=A0AA88ABF8_FICCA|nr:hypothetical protein TIFTF001_021903 [Ficus carica]
MATNLHQRRWPDPTTTKPTAVRVASSQARGIAMEAARFPEEARGNSDGEVERS